MYSCACGETAYWACDCYPPEPTYCGCSTEVPPAATSADWSTSKSAALRLRGGADPGRCMSVIIVGPDYDRAGPARIALPCLSTLEQLAEAIFAVYFGGAPEVPEEWQLRLMPSNIILAEGFTLLYPCFGAATSGTLMTWAGVVDRSVVQLYFLPQEPICDPLPPPSPAAGADKIACGEHVEEHVEEHVGEYVGEYVGGT